MRLASMITGVAAVVLALGSAHAQTPPKVKIGVLTDLTGSMSDLHGSGVVLAAHMAVEDFGGKVNGVPVEIIQADHQHKPDVGAGIARRWLDNEGVTVLADVTNSAVALAVNGVVRDKNKVFLATGPQTAALTAEACSPNTVQWKIDNWAVASGTVNGVVDTLNGKENSWFFLTADYAFGINLEDEARKVVIARGGKIVGAVRHPLNAPDMSSYLIAIQKSKAPIVGVAATVGDFTTFLKQAAEFGTFSHGQRVAALSAYITNIHSLGLKVAQGILLTEDFYWNNNEQTREFSRRFAKRHDGWMPTPPQANMYSAVLHYLKAVSALGDASDGKAVIAEMKKLPTDDPLFGHGLIREDGRQIHDIFLFEVKKPEESKEPWDYYKLVKTIPGAQAWRPLAEGNCSFVTGKR
jgi:branched-chain amino acid transport system substrate-binding protein